MQNRTRTVWQLAVVAVVMFASGCGASDDTAQSGVVTETAPISGDQAVTTASTEQQLDEAPAGFVNTQVVRMVVGEGLVDEGEQITIPGYSSSFCRDLYDCPEEIAQGQWAGLVGDAVPVGGSLVATAIVDYLQLWDVDSPLSGKQVFIHAEKDHSFYTNKLSALTDGRVVIGYRDTEADERSILVFDLQSDTPWQPTAVLETDYQYFWALGDDRIAVRGSTDEAWATWDPNTAGADLVPLDVGDLRERNRPVAVDGWNYFFQDQPNTLWRWDLASAPQEIIRVESLAETPVLIGSDVVVFEESLWGLTRMIDLASGQIVDFDDPLFKGVGSLGNVEAARFGSQILFGMRNGAVLGITPPSAAITEVMAPPPAAPASAVWTPDPETGYEVTELVELSDGRVLVQRYEWVEAFEEVSSVWHTLTPSG